MNISTHTLTWSVTTPPNVSTKYWNISTHTLTWSVTACEQTGKLSDFISTHTLTWSVTYLKNTFCYGLLFQLTRSRGAWQGMERSAKQWRPISTHTLTWSVTCKGKRTRIFTEKFQLTRSRGAWLLIGRITHLTAYFNSHAHVERDMLWVSQYSIIYDFNSHAHVERDVMPLFCWNGIIISTHTLTWSVTGNCMG